MSAIRWTTHLSSKVNLHHAIDLRAFCGENLVTYSLELWGNETPEVHRVVWLLQRRKPQPCLWSAYTPKHQTIYCRLMRAIIRALLFTIHAWSCVIPKATQSFADPSIDFRGTNQSYADSLPHIGPRCLRERVHVYSGTISSFATDSNHNLSRKSGEKSVAANWCQTIFCLNSPSMYIHMYMYINIYT